MIGSGILAGYKTYIVGVMSVLGFVTGYLMGDIDLGVAAQGVVTAVLAMTVRSGISAVAK